MLPTIALVVGCALIGTSVGVSGIGGFLIVPAMLLLTDSTPAEAVLTALLANVAATLATGTVAVVRRHVLWRVFGWLSLGGSAAALGSAWLVSNLSPQITRVIVALFLVAIGMVVLFGRQRPRVGRRAVKTLETVGIGALAQLSAVLAGIGGPAVTVPALTAQGQNQVMAIGTGLLHGVVISIVGIVVLLGASGAVQPTVELVLFPAIVVAFAFLANLLRSRFTSQPLIRRIVGLSSVAGGVFTLLTV
ncbi:MAG: sulfite exporter TauE/SafE family protein [Trueperaceae bacterium]